MTRPTIVQAEACAWCDVPYREHVQLWHPAIGWHGWVAPSKALIASRIRQRFRAKGWLPYYSPRATS